MKIKGNDIIVFFLVGNAWKAFAYGLSCEVDVTAETITVSNPMSGKWPKIKKKRLSWNGSSAHLLSDTIGPMNAKELITSTTPIKILFGSVEVHKESIECVDYVPDGRFFFSGEALVTRLTITGSKGTLSNLSMEFQGAGEPDFRDFNEVIMQGNNLLHEKESKVYNVID